MPHRGHKRAERDEDYPLYKRWPGSNRFYCCGKCVSGPDFKMYLLTLGSVIIPGVIFLGRVCTFYIIRFGGAGSPILIIGLFLFTSSLLFAFLTSCIDPGIIQRNILLDVEKETARPPPTKKVTLDSGEETILRYCNTCHIYRPPRAKHCYDCDNCVEKFDHHCPWMGTCIAARNYRFFVLFLMDVCVLMIYVFFVSAGVLVTATIDMLGEDDVPSFFWAMAYYPSTWLLMIYVCLLILPVGFLLSFHMYLVTVDRTTNEELTKKGKGFDPKGMFMNWVYLFMGPMTKKNVKFRQRGKLPMVQEQKFGPMILPTFDPAIYAPRTIVDMEGLEKDLEGMKGADGNDDEELGEGGIEVLQGDDSGDESVEGRGIRDRSPVIPKRIRGKGRREEEAEDSSGRPRGLAKKNKVHVDEDGDEEMRRVVMGS